MERMTAKMVQMNHRHAHHANVVAEHSNAKMAIAHHQQPFVTEKMTAETDPTKRTVTWIAQNWNSSAEQTDAAYLTVGNVTEIRTAKTAQMKIPPFVTNEPAIQRQNLHAKTDAAFRNCGCVTLTTIAVTIQTNPPTCAGKGTAPQVGNAARAEPTTGAFQNGCSVMEKTTVEITLMS